MRIVAGTAGSIPLHVPKGDLRPTMDMVRGAIFSSLGDLVIGARVLDLFAGTGALGLEALSRGAATATFIESDRHAVEAIRKNFAKTRLAGTIHALDVFRFLEKQIEATAYDLIFADPPYAKSPTDRNFPDELLANPALATSLAPLGLLILEHHPHVRLAPCSTWEILRQKRYGATAITQLQAVVSAEDPGSPHAPPL